MTNEYKLQEWMFSAFNTLNEVSGKEFLVGLDGERYVGNVAYPNEAFTPPDLDVEPHCWFELHVLADEPESVGLFKESQNRWTGYLQIDLHTPLDTGTAQVDAIYEWLKVVFAKGSEHGACSVNGMYRATAGAEADNYKTVFRVEFDADID